MLRHLASLTLLAATLVPARAADVELLLPDAADCVVSVNVRQLLDAAIVKQYLAPSVLGAIQAAIPELVRTTLRVDLTKDVSSMVGGFALDSGNRNGILIVRGRFDPAAMNLSATKFADREPRRVMIHPRDKRTICEFREPGGDAIFTCALDDKTLVVAWQPEVIDEAIAKFDGKRKLNVSVELRSIIEKLDTGYTVWGVAIPSKEFKQQLATPETAKLLDTVRYASGGITVGDGLQISCLIRTSDAKLGGELRQFAEAVKAILSLVAMDHKTQAPVLTTLVSGLQITNGPDGVSITGKVTKEQIEKAIQKAKSGER
jgi:hypothetical protein